MRMRIVQMTDPFTDCPIPEPSEAKLNPKAEFLSLFDKRDFSQALLEKAYDDVMSGKLGIHMRLIGYFWSVEGIEKIFNQFSDFVIYHGVPVNTTWEPRSPGGCWGVKFYFAEIKDCHKME